MPDLLRRYFSIYLRAVSLYSRAENIQMNVEEKYLETYKDFVIELEKRRDDYLKFVKPAFLFRWKSKFV